MTQMLNSANENQQLVLEILKQITSQLLNHTNRIGYCGLLSGLSGNLLFLYQMSLYESVLSNKKTSTNERLEEIVNEVQFNAKLEFVQEQLGNSIHDTTLNTGLSGQGWFLEYINQHQGTAYDADMCNEIDEVLVQRLKSPHTLVEIEMVLGLGSFAVYASRRQRKKDFSHLLLLLIDGFEKSFIQTGDSSLAWSQPAESVYRFNKQNKQAIEYNLGLAHGVPGIIAAILPALKVPQLFQRAKSLLIQSCNWLLEQELSNTKSASCYSSSCNDTSDSRLGWCYGDLTIALTLARVGKELKCPVYLDKATQISLHAANRDSRTAMVKDASLCHGSAGLVLIFQLLDHYLKEPALIEAANRWLLFTLELYQKDGLKGFHMYDSIKGKYQESSGMLMGYSGIGLCLLSALGQPNDWVDSLLMA